jgi:hypothetical protein
MRTCSILLAVAINVATTSMSDAVSLMPPMPRLDIQFGENNYLSASDRERLKSLEDAAKRLSKTALLVSVTASEDRTGIG